MKNIAVYMPDIRESLKNRKLKDLTEILKHIPAVDLAEDWQDFSEEERPVLFNVLKFDKKVEVFERLSFEEQKEIIDSITTQPLGKILDEMASDERVDLFEQLTEIEVKKLFSLMKDREVKDVKDLLEYDEQTAGGKMTTEFVTLSPEMTARESLLKLHESVKTKEVRNIYALYEVDEQGKLIAGISLQRLIASNPEDRIKDIARSVDNIKVHVDHDQEEVAQSFTHYDLLSAPVVDDNNKLLGIITIDDIVDVIHQEATEDIAKMAGTESEELLSKSVFKIFKIRWPWLFASWLGGLVALAVIGRFEKTLINAVAVVSFIPVIMGMGGNIGVQSSTIVVRGLALGKIDINRVWTAVFKEIKVGVALGLSYGILLGLVAQLKYMNGQDQKLGLIGLVAGLGIFLSMTIAAALGSLMPVIFKRINIDPAVATGPIVTTIIDVIGLSVYFLLATLILF